MTALENGSIQLCALATAAAIVRLLFPDLRKYGVFALLRAVLLLTAFAVLFPALEGAWREAAQAPAYAAAPLVSSDEYYAEAAREALRAAVAEKLSSEGINVRDVRIELTVGEESVSVDAIVLSLQEDAPPQFAQELSDLWEVPVRIETEGGRAP